MEPLTGEDPTHIGVYQLRARIGAGGMGRVYLGYTPGGRPVALKVVRPEFNTDQLFRARFRQEVNAARRVHGLYTAQVLDADPDATPPWLATAYIPGPSLQDALSQHGPLPPESVVQLTAGVAEALQAIHAAGVVHRDLKPSNVILAPDGPRVIDFGIARAADASAITRQGARVGTPLFMAPEQILGRTATAAVDVFALGHLAAYSVLGRLPFGPADDAVFARIVNQEPNLDGCPAPLRGVIEQCLRKDPAARPSPAEVIEACRALQNPVVGRGGGGVSGPWLPPEFAAAAARYAAPPPPVPMPAPEAVQGLRSVPAPGPTPTEVYRPGNTTPAVDGLVVRRATLVWAGVAVVAVGALVGLGVALLPGSGTNGSAGGGSPTVPAETATQPAGAGSRTSAAGPPATHTAQQAAAAPGTDPCLVGTWSEVNRTFTPATFQGPVTFTAHGPATYVFRADGSATVAFDNDIFNATVNGAPWMFVVNGGGTYDYHTSNGTMLMTNIDLSGTEVLYVNGVKYATYPLTSRPTSTYTCSGNALSDTSTDGAYAFQASRSG